MGENGEPSLARHLVCGDREAILQDRGAEVRVFTGGGYRTTQMSEADARAWCSRRGLNVLRVER